MKVIENRQIVTDSWQHISDDTNIGQLPNGKIIVTQSYWNTHKQILRERGTALGIRLTPETEISEIAVDLAAFSLIALDFPGFRDGRAYSQARILRQQYDYQGELRATGNVLRDQLMFMERVGFTSFEIDNGRDIEDALNAFSEINVKYQPSSDASFSFGQKSA